MTAIRINVNGEMVERALRSKPVKSADGFHAYVNLGGKRIKVKKPLGKGNRAWTPA